MSQKQRTAVIIGAGPAGLTAAYELLEETGVHPLVLERSEQMGGISRTVVHNGNRIDIGGHRFFSKSDRVMAWWLDKLPLQALDEGSARITYQRSSREIEGGGAGPDPETTDEVMLLRQRRSRIYYLRQFFDYPISLSPETLSKLGLRRTARIGLSYLRSSLFPIREPENLEEFFINRFGRELYLTFFKDYTEKVWGTSCRDISAEWGAQRIKGLSIRKAVWHFLRKLFSRGGGGLAQKGTETSLIEQFLYPKHGPGQMWEVVAREVRERGGEVLTGWTADRLLTEGERVVAVEAVSAAGERRRFEADYVFSSMPVRSLVRAFEPGAPAEVVEVAEGLVYRDFITVGLLAEELAIREDDGGPIRDNWIYVQEPDVLVGRLQIFNNWSPYMVADPTKTWIGLEYFCDAGDALWRRSDAEMIELGKEELHRIGILDRAKVLDGVVIRMPKTYPAYFGSYDRFDVVRRWVDRFENLFLVGRNGMHKYNNQDHSMLTAMLAVEDVRDGRTDKARLWEVNVEEEYHEEKAPEEGAPPEPDEQQPDERQPAAG